MSTEKDIRELVIVSELAHLVGRAFTIYNKTTGAAYGLDGQAILDYIDDSIANRQITITFGIADSNAVKINATDVSVGDYARFTDSGLQGRSAAEVISDLGAEAVANKNVAGGYAGLGADAKVLPGLLPDFILSPGDAGFGLIHDQIAFAINSNSELEMVVIDDLTQFDFVVENGDLILNS